MLLLLFALVLVGVLIAAASTFAVYGARAMRSVAHVVAVAIKTGRYRAS